MSMVSLSTSIESVCNADSSEIKIHSTLSFLFLKFQRDASDWASLDSFHQVGGKTCDFVSQSLGRDDGDFIRDSLVRGEIES